MCNDNNNNNKVFIFLMNLKLGITFFALGVLFNVHCTTISRIFVTYSVLVIKTSAFIFWPSKKTI